MRILIAPASFKGSAAASEAAAALAKGLRESLPDAELDLAPVADGGEGTLELLVEARGGELRTCETEDALGRPRAARFGLIEEGRVALVESAEAVGLPLLDDDERDPLAASSDGVGLMVRAALDAGAEWIEIGLGGSATVDGGAGFLRALGAKLEGSFGSDLPRGGGALSELSAMDLGDLDARLKDTELVALCDVSGPLLGPRGARLYMRQKGADEDGCDRLEAGLARLAAIGAEATGTDVGLLPGAGAAGGLGAGVALAGGRLVSGSDRVLEVLGMGPRLVEAGLVITGEGRFDVQSAEGKATGRLLSLSKALGKPVVLVAGSVAASEEELGAAGVTLSIPLARDEDDTDAAMKTAPGRLRAVGRAIGERIAAGALPLASEEVS
jgi:glycerate kinase